MLRFLLWNLKGKPLQSSIAALVRAYEVDIIVLVENRITTADLLRSLNSPGTADYYDSPCLQCSKIHIFSRFLSEFSRPFHESDRLTIRHVRLPGRVDFLLAAVHFPDKTHWNDESQIFECVRFVDEITDTESKIGHTRTILMGDFNMNPFEAGMISARGFHATMSRQIAHKNSRIVQGKRYPYFYNPMWGLMGDATPGPAGTYYYDNAEHTTLFWNMFDQVLVRPELLPAFNNGSLQILETVGDVSLLSRRGIPNKRRGSDHLPILFDLNL